jgi:hypothetical protein
LGGVLALPCAPAAEQARMVFLITFELLLMTGAYTLRVADRRDVL